MDSHCWVPSLRVINNEIDLGAESTSGWIRCRFKMPATRTKTRLLRIDPLNVGAWWRIYGTAVVAGVWMGGREERLHLELDLVKRLET